MTDEELDSFEVAAKKMIETSCGPFASFYNEDFSKVILELIAELRLAKQRCTQLAKERTYLAKCLEYNNGPDMRVPYYEYIARAKKVTCGACASKGEWAEPIREPEESHDAAE